MFPGVTYCLLFNICTWYTVELFPFVFLAYRHHYISSSWSKLQKTAEDDKHLTIISRLYVIEKKVWKESILLFESANYAKKGAIEFGIWRSLPVNVVIELWPNWLFWVFKLQQGVTCSFFLLDWYNFFKSENDHTAYYIRLKGTIVETKKIKWEHKCGRN